MSKEKSKDDSDFTGSGKEDLAFDKDKFSKGKKFDKINLRKSLGSLYKSMETSDDTGDTSDENPRISSGKEKEVKNQESSDKGGVRNPELKKNREPEKKDQTFSVFGRKETYLEKKLSSAPDIDLHSILQEEIKFFKELEKEKVDLGLSKGMDFENSLPDMQEMNVPLEESNEPKNHDELPPPESEAPALPPNIYDILLRVYYLFQADWLIWVEEGQFRGIITKKYVLSKLSEIHKMNDPLSRELSEKNGLFPTLIDALENFRTQKTFPLVDKKGQVQDKVSRGFVLELIEESERQGGPVPLLSVSLPEKREPRLAEEKIDVPDRKRAGKAETPKEADFKEQDATQNIDWFMSLLLESIPAGLVAIDKKARIIFYNDSFKKLLKGKNLLKTIEDFEKLLDTKLKGHTQKRSTKGGVADTRGLLSIHLKEFKIQLRGAPLSSGRSEIGYIFLAESG
jgi:PAS domain-containing protein